MSEELRYRIGERRICWPEPKDICLSGVCSRCNHQPYRPLGQIEQVAHTRGGNAVTAYKYGRDNEFFGTDTRASREDLEAYVDSIGVLALKEMADGMVGGTHGRSRADVVAYALRFRREVLDESFRLSRRGAWKSSEIR